MWKKGLGFIKLIIGFKLVLLGWKRYGRVKVII